MKLRRNRRGFTIVELVIVVAVIGVLAAVLIPTFINLTNKANKASDNSLVQNLNTALAGREGEADDTENKTMQDAVEDLEKWGYKLENLVTKSSDKLLWNIKTNRFCLEDKADLSTYKAEDYWKIVKNVSEMGNYSGYAHSSFNMGTGENEGKIEVSAGFDVGTVGTFKTITYNNSNGTAKKDVTIRTAGGTLVINGYVDSSNKEIGDKVDHYGEGLVLNVTKMPMKSYHEYGYFPKATISEGRIVVEEDGDLPSVEVTSTNKVEIETDKDIAVSVSAANGDNVSINVTNNDANVALDEKIDADDVAGNKVTIKKVQNMEQLKDAVANRDEYIQFANDITDHNEMININYSVTIDGDNHKDQGTGGIRTKQVYCLYAVNAQDAVSGIEVAFKNITLTNTKTSGQARVLETRAGGMKSFSVINSTVESKSNNVDANPVCLGGSSTIKMDVLIKDSSILTTSGGYATLVWVPVDLNIVNSTLSGYAGLYFKPGSNGSSSQLTNSTITAPSVHSGATDNFGAIVFEDGNMTMDLVDCIIDVTGPGKATQTAILFSVDWAAYLGGNLTNIPVKISGGNTFINGEITTAQYYYYDPTNYIEISGGRYTWNPSEYLADGCVCRTEGGLYIVE